MFAKSIDNFLNCGYNKSEHFFSAIQLKESRGINYDIIFTY